MQATSFATYVDVSDDVEELHRCPEFIELVQTFRALRFIVLAGAGCSTESGIPDYRGPRTRHRKREPVRYQHFVRDPALRARYWARSTVGWPYFSKSKPNVAHQALGKMEALGRVRGVVTQNVDGLHQAGDSREVIELHGTLNEVRCLQCGAIEARDVLQERLLDLNPSFSALAHQWAPDGDADLDDHLTRDFRVPHCTACLGLLKPNVVFFGENVPKPTVERVWQWIDHADGLLVVGSSLTVYSGYRFVRGAAERRLPIGIINLGSTRGDELAWVRLHARLGLALPQLLDALR